METETEEITSSPLSDLIASLEQATLMAKQLPHTTDPARLTQIHSTLHSAHHSLSLFLSHSSLYPLPPLRPSLLGDPMDDGVDEEIEAVEERMKEVFIQNKRSKRQLSPESVAVIEEEEVRQRGEAVREFDPVGTKVRALDLVFQFHG